MREYVSEAHASVTYIISKDCVHDGSCDELNLLNILFFTSPGVYGVTIISGPF